MEDLYRGKIGGFSGNYSSGLGYLIINDKPILCENAPTVRAFESAYGNIIRANHTADFSGIVGEEIVFKLDSIGLLEFFYPVDEADDDLILKCEEY